MSPFPERGHLTVDILGGQEVSNRLEAAELDILHLNIFNMGS
jgi:hypothetical protein